MTAPSLGLPRERQATYPGDSLNYLGNLTKRTEKIIASNTNHNRCTVTIVIKPHAGHTDLLLAPFFYTNVYLLYILFTQLNSLYAAIKQSVCTQQI